MAYISYDKHGPEYKRLWDTMKIIRDDIQLQNTSNGIKKFKEVYQKVEKETGIPWQMVAVIHVREAGLSDVGKWKGVLHNGQKIVGTGRKTTIVPIGRGPFSTWHEAAVHALKEKGFDKIKSWPIERVLWALEPYNGYGYRNKGLRSPYLWASTNHQQSGKYVADHVFDHNVTDSQVGCAALLKYLGMGSKAGLGASTVTAGALISAGGTYTYWDWITTHPRVSTLIALGIAGIIGMVVWAAKK